MAKKEANLERLPQCVAEYIAAVVRKMGYRRKVRREVQRELIDHFEDALHECRDENEAQKRAEQLISSFGDAKLLGKLIRRGKKRCRPLWKKTIIRSLQGAALLIVLFVCYTGWFLLGKPTVTVDYLALLNERARPEVHEQDNAWPLYEKAIELYVEQPSIPEGVEDLETYNEFFRSQIYTEERIRTWTRRYEPHWDNLSSPLKGAVKACLAQEMVPFVYLDGNEPVYRYRDFATVTKGIIKNFTETGRPLFDKQAEPNESEPARLPDDQTRQIIAQEIDQKIAQASQRMEQELLLYDFTRAVCVAVLRERERDRRIDDTPPSILEGEFASKADLLKWVEQNEPDWQEYVKASRKPYYWRAYEVGGVADDKGEWLVSIMLPELPPVKGLAKLGRWRVRIEREQGRPEEALDTCVTIARVGRHWQDRKGLIEQLVGIAISALAHTEIMKTCAANGVSAGVLTRTQHALEEIYRPAYPLIDISTEKLMFLDTVQHVFTDGGPGGGHLIPREMAPLIHWQGDTDPEEQLQAVALGLLHAGRDETVSQGMELFDRVSETIKLSPYTRRGGKVTSMHDALKGLSKYRYAFVRAMLPALDRAGELAYRAKAMHEATLTVLALQRWRLEKGEYPEELQGLVGGGYLKTLPSDPYSDGPLRYEWQGDDFLLYSLGGDFDDDNGTRVEGSTWGDEDTSGDYVFWPVERDSSF